MEALLPVDGNAPKFAQLFFIDFDNVNQPRQCVQNLDQGLLSSIHTILCNTNNYIKSFKTAIEINNTNPELKIVVHSDFKKG